MGGGRGDLAFTPAAKKLDASLKKECTNFLKQHLTNFTYKKKLNPDEIPGGFGACEPDGGIHNGENDVLVLEAKHQQDAGNAIDRWHKNNRMIHKVYREKRVLYVTICSGSGAKKNGAISKSIGFEHCNSDGIIIELHELTKLKIPNHSYNICIMSPSGYNKSDVLSICEKFVQHLT